MFAYLCRWPIFSPSAARGDNNDQPTALVAFKWQRLGCEFMANTEMRAGWRRQLQGPCTEALIMKCVSLKGETSARDTPSSCSVSWPNSGTRVSGPEPDAAEQPPRKFSVAPDHGQLSQNSANILICSWLCVLVSWLVGWLVVSKNPKLKLTTHTHRLLPQYFYNCNAPRCPDVSEFQIFGWPI